MQTTVCSAQKPSYFVSKSKMADSHFKVFAVLRSCSLCVRVAPLWHSMVDSASAENVGGKLWLMLCEAFTETTLNLSLYVSRFEKITHV